MKTTIKVLIYNLIDLFTLHKGIPRKINGFLIRFPARWARYFEDDYEKENVDFIKHVCHEGMNVIDIGAHLGLISLIISKIVGSGGKVYAFEPTPFTFNEFKKIVTLNKVASIVEPINKAIAKQKGILNFFLSADEGSKSNSLVSRNHRQRHAISIETTSIDDFVSEKKLHRLDLIKIDAEGTEYDVLQGAIQSFHQFRPKVILAIHPSLIANNQQKPEAIFDLIKSLHYEITYKGKTMSKLEFCANTDFFDVQLIPSN